MVFLGGESHAERDYSDKTAEIIDQEVLALISEAETRARDLMTKNKAAMERMVAALIEKETIEQDEIKAIMGEPPKKSEVVLENQV
jgi:cell division protease FtsH